MEVIKKTVEYPLLTKALMFRAYEVEEIAKALEEVGE